MAQLKLLGGGSLIGGPTLRRPRHNNNKLKLSQILFAGLGLFLVGYFFLVLSFLKVSGETPETNGNLKSPVVTPSKEDLLKLSPPKPNSNSHNATTTTKQLLDSNNMNKNNNNNNLHIYDDWKALAVDLAGKLPHEVLGILKSQDPFGVRGFEERLLQAESDKEALLDMDEVQRLFPCPPINNRITLPDVRNHAKAAMFRNGTKEVFLFFQHLRKAGGTNFCGLAQHNLPKAQVPHYYCMPDMDWSGNKCGGCFSKYTNEQIETKMHDAGHRILGNEWDPFDRSRFFDLPATFATSFRKPLDRAVSQFRFECVEDRGCKIKNITSWWSQRRDLTNVYTWTFAKQGIRKISIGTTPDAAKARQGAMAIAMDVITKFNLVMVMEWLAYSPEHVRDVLGFQDTTTVTERIRPHIGQAKRNDGQEHNSLGAAGIAKASWKPEEYLSATQYKRMSEDLALDEILTDAARRMFLERMVCPDMKEAAFLS